MELPAGLGVGPEAPVVPKRRFSLGEGYLVAVQAARSLPGFLRHRRSLGAAFVERIMLAVTEVNGCPVCSYAHARLALEAGLGQDEIELLFAGDLAEAPADHVPALLFAQHYADRKGRPDRAAWERIEDVYGPKTARGILGAIRMIMWGNAYGIPLSGLRSRRRGQRLPGSSLPADLAMMVASVVQLPLVALHALLANLTRRPLV